MKKTLVAAACLAATGFAFAAAPAAPMTAKLGWYVGAGINYTAVTAARFRPENDLVSDYDFKQDHAQLGFNLLVGNRLSNHFGSEFGYQYVGNTRYQDRDSHDARIESINNYDFYYDGIFYMPLNLGSVNGVDVFAKGGLAFMHTKDQYNDPAATGDNTRFSNALSTFALNYGAGIQYNWNQFTVRGTYNHIQPMRYHNDQFIIPDTINLDVLYHFG